MKIKMKFKHLLFISTWILNEFCCMFFLFSFCYLRTKFITKMRNLLPSANRNTFTSPIICPSYTSYFRWHRFLKILSTIARPIFNQPTAKPNFLWHYNKGKNLPNLPSIFTTQHASLNWIIKILNLFAVELFAFIRHP